MPEAHRRALPDALGNADQEQRDLAGALGRTRIMFTHMEYHGGELFSGVAYYPPQAAQELLDDIALHADVVDAVIHEADCTGASCGGECGEPPRQRGYYDGRTGMQPFDVIDEFGLDFYEGNVVKYVVRWRKKNGLEDLRKARTYIDALITRAERGGH